MKRIICATFLSIFTLLFKSDAQTTGITVKMDGYLINLGGLKLFQPCEDSTRGIWEALDNTSFILSCDYLDDLYCEAIDNIGDSVFVTTYDTSIKKTVYEKFAYFKCSLEVVLFILNPKWFKIYDKPSFDIFFNGKQYYLRGFDVENRVKKIIPSDKKSLMLMFHYYTSNGYSVPEWLENIVLKQRRLP